MDNFIEQLEVLKQMYTQLPAEQHSEALDLMDQYLEQMGHSSVFNVSGQQEECLMSLGQTEVNDYLDSSLPFYPTTSSNYSPEYQPPTYLYCYTCGASFNNRKSLYRHGIAMNHQTREQKVQIQRIRRSYGHYSGEGIQNQMQGIQNPMELDEDILNLDGEEDQDEEDNEGADGNWQCYECKRSFGNRKALYRHGKRSSHMLRLRRAPRSKGGPISCPNCSYHTANQSNLRRHLQRAHRRSSDNCDNDKSDKEAATDPNQTF